MQKKIKKMFIFDIVCDMTSYYHNDAGVNVVADTIEDAIKMIVEYSQEHCDTPMTTFSQMPDAEYEVFADNDAIYVFPNAGCC